MSKYGANIDLPNPSCTRLVTIVAHVDHGKTTLADNLVTANGIISERQAGSIRYLDSTEEEQRRGITMHASAIGLKHTFKKKMHVIHLVDSPGHLDFCQEVTTSLMACDGALVVIDAIEGMGARLHAVLRETYGHELVPILVVNKIDRLCTELLLGKIEAYVKIRVLLESVNAVCASMINADETEHSEEYKEMWNFDPAKGNVIFGSAIHNWGFSIPGVSRSLFRSGTLPNIKPMVSRKFLFGDFKYNSEKEKIFTWKQHRSDGTEEDEELPMFAEFCLGPIWDVYEAIKEYTGFCKRGKDTNNFSETSRKQKISLSTPGIAQLMSAITAGSISPDNYPINNIEELQKVLNGASTSLEGIQRAILRRFRSLSEAVLNSSCNILPDPIEASIRKDSLKLRYDFDNKKLTDKQRLSYKSFESALCTCKQSNDVVTYAHVFKFVAVSRRDLNLEPFQGTGSEDNTSSTVLLGMTRVLSGVLCSGDVAYTAISPKLTENENELLEKRAKRKIQLYLIMGSSFVAVNKVPAGHICAASNLDDLRWRTLTLCDREDGIPLRGVALKSKPLVKVGVSASVPSETKILQQGLVRLSLADASIDITITKRGETIVAALGELHLENALRDLAHVYCGNEIKINTSDPIVEFGEGTTYFDFEKKGPESVRKAWTKTLPLRQLTITPYCDEDGIENAKLGRCRAMIAGKSGSISFRVLPLSQPLFRRIECFSKDSTNDNDEISTLSDELLLLASLLEISEVETCEDKESKLSSIIKTIAELSCAYDTNGCNIMMQSKQVLDGDAVLGVEDNEVYSAVREVEEGNSLTKTNSDSVSYSAYQQMKNTSLMLPSMAINGNEAEKELIHLEAHQIWKTRMLGSAIAGFQAAMRSGPLCEEHIRGVLVIIEGVEIALKKVQDSYELSKPIGGGMVLSATRQGIRCAFLSRPARLVEGYFRLSLHSSLEGLGPLYNILSKRRGRVVEDTMVDGTQLLLIEALLPQAEAFGLTQELLLRSSGNVTAPEMIFSHYEILDEDPFWIPSSLEEREDFGEIISSGDTSTGVVKHRGLTYLRKMRRRKGLVIDEEKILKDGEKQRTLARKK